MKKHLSFDKVKKFWNFNLAYLIPDYKFNNLIFRLGILLIAVWLVFAAQSNNWDFFRSPVYFRCDQMSGCINPYYAPSDSILPCLNPDPRNHTPDRSLCSREFFISGESYGRPPSFLLNFSWDFAGLISGCMVLLNHFLYNRGYFKKRINEDAKND